MRDFNNVVVINAPHPLHEIGSRLLGAGSANKIIAIAISFFMTAKNWEKDSVHEK